MEAEPALQLVPADHLKTALREEASLKWVCGRWWVDMCVYVYVCQKVHTYVCVYAAAYVYAAICSRTKQGGIHTHILESVLIS